MAVTSSSFRGPGTTAARDLVRPGSDISGRRRHRCREGRRQVRGHLGGWRGRRHAAAPTTTYLTSVRSARARCRSSGLSPPRHLPASHGPVARAGGGCSVVDQVSGPPTPRTRRCLSTVRADWRVPSDRLHHDPAAAPATARPTARPPTLEPDLGRPAPSRMKPSTAGLLRGVGAGRR